MASEKRLAIMQPYFLPYIGYYELIAAVDVFVVYDNIKYTKRGWINRNRMLVNGANSIFSLPLKKASDSLDVAGRELAEDFSREKLLNRFKGAYCRAPYFSKTFALLQKIIGYEENNLFNFIYHSIVSTCGYLGIETKILISSHLSVDHELKAREKVMAFCEALGARLYINASGGMELYSKEEFAERDIKLQFLKPKTWEYQQFNNPFVPWLSIVDVLMFNSLDEVRERIQNHCELI